MKNDVDRTREDLAVEAKVEAASTWTPSEWSRFKRQSRAMMRELHQEARINAGRLSDLHDRVYPGADCDCDPRCARCSRADEIAASDPLVQEIGGLLSFWDEVAGLEADHDEFGDDLEMESRLRKLPARPSNWVEMARRRRHDDAARRAALAPEPERPLPLEERPHPGQMSGIEKCREIEELAEQLAPEQFYEVLAQLRARVEFHRELRRVNDAGIAARRLDPDVAALVDELSVLRAESEEAYQRVAKVIRKVHGELLREAREVAQTQ